MTLAESNNRRATTQSDEPAPAIVRSKPEGTSPVAEFFLAFCPPCRNKTPNHGRLFRWSNCPDRLPHTQAVAETFH